MTSTAHAIASMLLGGLLGSTPDAAVASDAGAGPAPAPAASPAAQPPAERDGRMGWWREARFGMFIHWGLYSILEGRWGERDSHGEWIRTTAQIPLERYDALLPQFNPVRFDADQWMRLAKQAGMEYVVITSKHHDGFCLFDSEATDFDVMATPFRRDIMREIADAARRQDVVPCWYHSIMDWHHPDYLPRRDWEKGRSAEGADFDRFERYLHAQVRELLTRYGPIGVLWFDGEWENTWTHERGKRLYALCRELQPSIIVNNRVDKGRNDMAGLNRAGDWAGDFGTPEQEVPAQGIPGVDWESCMTMNGHWGWNAADTAWKSTTELVRTLVDVASKGGNFLLNVGPQPDGTLPEKAIERMRGIGAWMQVNGESIHGTTASRFGALPWGRSTTRVEPDGRTTLYLHVFERPARGSLQVPGLWDQPASWRVLGAETKGGGAATERRNGGLALPLPEGPADPMCMVLRLDYPRPPTIYTAPTIAPPSGKFLGTLAASLSSAVAPPTPAATAERPATLHYTLDGSLPTPTSPVYAAPIPIDRTTTVTAQLFRGGTAAAPPATATYTKAVARPGAAAPSTEPGLGLATYRGRFSTLPDWSTLKPESRATAGGFSLPAGAGEDVLLVYEGWLEVDRDAVRDFVLVSDDGSRLWIGDELVVDNDGLHGAQERRGAIALGKGWHPIRVALFNRTGGFHLEVLDGPAGATPAPIATARLRR